jgi:hypothetical protein
VREKETTMVAEFVASIRMHRVVETHHNETGGIDQIRVQEPDGMLVTIDVAEAIRAMVQGTDAFFVCASDGPWSPVTPWPYRSPDHLRSITDHEDGSNLENLPTWV